MKSGWKGDEKRMERGWKENKKGMKRGWKGDEKGMKREWKGDEKVMKREWKGYEWNEKECLWLRLKEWLSGRGWNLPTQKSLSSLELSSRKQLWDFSNKETLVQAIQLMEIFEKEKFEKFSKFLFLV